MQITRKSDTGEYYLMLLNNSGVARSVANGEQLLPEGEICVGLTVKGGKTLCKLEGNGNAEPMDGHSCRVTIPSGGWFFAKL